MYFVTDEPVLFNVQTGVSIYVSQFPGVEMCDVSFGSGDSIYSGTRQECQDFIYSVAGWVGAVNPVTLERVKS